MPHRVLTALVLLFVIAPDAQAQWHLGAGLQVQSFGRWVVSAPHQLGGGPDGRPTTTWPVVVELHRGGAGTRFGIAVSRTRPGLEIWDTELRIALRPAFQVIGLVPSVSVPVLRLEHGAAVRLGLGAPIERWAFPGSADLPRWRLGADAVLSVEAPLTARMSGRATASVGTLFSHPLKATDTLEEYRPTHTWRRTLGLGVLVRL